MKKVVLFLMLAVAAFSLTACIDDNEDPDSGKIVIWSSGEELGRFVEGFNEIYPDIEVEITVVPNSEFVAKLTPALSSGVDAPDLFTGESDYVKYLVETPFWDDLSNYGVEEYTSDMWDYVLSGGTDSNGVIKALSWQASPGSVMYRRDIALEVFGTDDPEDISQLLYSNQKMLDTAAILKAEGYNMFASWQDLMNMQFSNRVKPWVENDELIIDESMLDFMDMAKDIYDNEYDLNADPWSGEWFAAVEGDTTFSYVLPTWGYQFLIKPSAVTTSGQWALAEGPVPYVKGGTWLGINKDSDNKELAWKFLEYVACNTEAQQAYATEYGEYMSLKSADIELAKADGEVVLGGQNLYEFFNTQMAKVPNDHMTAYDGQINNAFLSATKAYITGTMTKEEAIQSFKDDVETAYPDLTVN
jgi:ABC-type glycerol-3-phosphate transport system substrate-binding protein